MKKPVACYTSFTFSYLSRARLLAWSLKRFHPDWHFVAVITDQSPPGIEFKPEDELFDEIIWGHELPVDNVNAWLFKHDIVEACTAVKGMVLENLAKEGFEKVIYLDPDIAVFNTLQPILDILQEENIVLTPHQTIPESNPQSIYDNEISSLKHGIYNLGFVAIRSDADGLKFAKWWAERLREYCFDDIPNGLFTDQRWCDHAPAFFDGVHILKDPGYNIASWNLSNRVVTITEDGSILVNGKTLRFYHLTKFGPVGELMTSRYALDNIPVYEIWAWYRRKLKEFELPNLPDRWWYYGTYENGEIISKEQRLLYKERKDLQKAYPNPFSCSENSYYGWLQA